MGDLVLSIHTFFSDKNVQLNLPARTVDLSVYHL